MAIFTQGKQQKKRIELDRQSAQFYKKIVCAAFSTENMTFAQHDISIAPIQETRKENCPY